MACISVGGDSRHPHSPGCRPYLSRAKRLGTPLGVVVISEKSQKYARSEYAKPFVELAEPERGNVFLKIVESSGRDRPKVSLRAQRLARVGKAFWVFTAAVAIYNIATADDKV